MSDNPDEQLLEYANDPASIANADLARAVLEALDRASASIQASLDTAHLRAQAEGLDAVDEDWFHRASNALHHIEFKQHRVAKRLKKLEPREPAPAPTMSPEQSAGKLELERIRQQTHLESMRLAGEAKARREEEFRKRDRERERRFVDIARHMLPKETYLQIWREVDAAEAAGDKSGPVADITPESGQREPGAPTQH